MTVQKITLSNNSSTVYTITNVVFNTPTGIQHTANLSQFSGGIANFTATSFTTYTTMTEGMVVQFTIDHTFVNTSTGITSGTVIISATEGISKTIETEIRVTSTPRVKKIASTNFVHNVLPFGTVLTWSGTIANIPTGWQLCDGTNGTPDLRNRFLIGANSDSGSTASTLITGSATVTGGNKDAVNVAHDHDINDPGHFHDIVGASGLEGGGGQPDITGNDSYLFNSGSTTTDITIVNTGTSGTNMNLPPYYALAFIMKMTDENDITI